MKDLTRGELKKRLLEGRSCLVRELREGAFKTWTFLPERNALLSGDGKLMLVLVDKGVRLQNA